MLSTKICNCDFKKRLSLILEVSTRCSELSGFTLYVIICPKEIEEYYELIEPCFESFFTFLVLQKAVYIKKNVKRIFSTVLEL